MNNSATGGGSERCFICGEGNPNVFNRHHIIRRSQGGADSDENLVTLCASCHEAVEKIYDDEFWSRVEVVDSKTEDHVKNPEPLSTPSEYAGDQGRLVCPGCSTKIGWLSSDADVTFTNRPCCDIGHADIPTLTVIDEMKSEHMDTSSEALKIWLLDRWSDFLSENHSTTVEEWWPTGFGPDGEPLGEYTTKEVDLTSTRLSEFRIAAAEWGWSDVVDWIDSISELADEQKQRRKFQQAMGVLIEQSDINLPENSQTPRQGLERA